MITEPWEMPARSKRYGRSTRQSESESGCPTLMLDGKYVAKSVTVASSLYLLSSLYQKMRKKTSGYTAFVFFYLEKFICKERGGYPLCVILSEGAERPSRTFAEWIFRSLMLRNETEQKHEP
jgi:hypothetical protein